MSNSPTNPPTLSDADKGLPSRKYRKPIIQRLMERIIIDENGCWVFQGCTTNGYGSISGFGRGFRTHRPTARRKVSERA